ncbi:DUF2142 domain-containing protein [Allofournierella sp.]|uniref:DUF2142 domain-containing protein n=1 Tax=Allofournierella sp. TaxID=1940256 RepID=UPI002E7802DD|nr:DUF2142 domain-containing protein [Fournierella sp.]MEE0757576.1 DUF2142 domain-containing protein [Fournierella sp.]
MQNVLTFFKTHRRALAGALLCFFLFAVFAAVWLTHIRGQGDKSSSWAINDQFHSFAAIEEKMEQRFSCDRDLLALSLVLAAEDTETPPEGELELILTDSATGEELARSTGDMRYIYNGWDAYYTTLGLDRFVENPGEAVEYTLTLIPHYTGEGRLCVGYEEGGMPAGVSLTVDGEEVDGTVAMLGTQARVGGFLTKFYWVFALGCIAAAGLLYWLYCRRTVPLHRMVFCAVLVLGFAFNVLLPPYAAPDETYHINQSFTLASTLYDPHLPVAKSHIRDTIRRPSDQDALIQVDETTVFTWQHIAKVIGRPNTDPTFATHTFDEYQVDSSYTLYWISGFGVLIGYWLHLGFAATLYLGRLANLLFFAFLAAWAVKRTPVAKPAFAVAALLPMTLHLAVSYSRDSNLLALCFFFSALLLDLAFGPREHIGWKQLVLPVVLAVLIVPSKVVYLPLAGLILLIPAVRLGRFARWIKGGFLALCAVAFLLNSGAAGALIGFTQTSGTAAAGAASLMAQEQAAQEPVAPESDVQSAVQASSGEATQSAAQTSGGAESASQAADPAEEGAAAEPSASSSAAQPASETAGSASEPAAANSFSTQEDLTCFTLPYILSHPLETAELCIRSVVEEGDHYLSTLVGGTLGYFGLDKPLDLAWGWIILLYGLLALAWLCPEEGGAMPPAARWGTLFIALCCCGLAVLGCISWTPTYYETIYGFQGRYFLPVLPLLLLVRPKALCLAGDCRRGIVLAAALVDIDVLLNVFLAVVAR